MKVLVVNCGSSSLKYQIIDSDTEKVEAKGLCERIGIDGRLVYQPEGGEKEITEAPMPTHSEAIQMVLDALVNPKTGVLKSLDEIEAIGGSELAGKIGAVSAEHLIVVRRSGIRSMAEGNVIACLLPATSFYLNAEFALARAFIDEGVAVALGSDYNPGSCPSLNLQFVMNLACLKYRLTPEEMLTAVTLNASAAIGLSGITGSVEKGKQADLVFWNAEDLDYLAYRMGSNLVRAVVKKGKVVYER